ncbi:MAG: hypothetical protein IKM48_08685 [Clostridia bacterium]|nr:hypothetical protein [Clostridia bacterium]
MAIGVTDSKHYEAIADVIRECLSTDEKYKSEEMADRVGEAINKAYENGIVEGEDQGYDTGYIDGWDFGESSGTHDGFEVGVGFGEDTKSIVCFSGYESENFDGDYELTIDNPKQLIVTVSKECYFDAFELTDAEGTTHTLDVGQLDAGTHTFDIPDGFVCNADDGYGEVYLEGQCDSYGIVGVSVTSKSGYDEGRDVEWWRDYQGVDDTDATYLAFLFAGYRWGETTFTPQFDIKSNHPTTTALATQMFYQHNANGTPYDMVEHLKKLDVVLDTSKFAAMGQCFRYAAISRLGIIDTTALSSKSNSANLFANSKLVTIDVIVMKTRTFDWNGNEFSGCNLLEHLTIEGEIGNNGLSFSDCPLDHDSLMSIIDHLKDFSGTGETRSITFGATNLAKLSDADKAIATQKGWTLL